MAPEGDMSAWVPWDHFLSLLWVQDVMLQDVFYKIPSWIDFGY